MNAGRYRSTRMCTSEQRLRIWCVADLTSYTFMERTCNLQTTHEHTTIHEAHGEHRVSDGWCIASNWDLGMTNVNVYRHRSCTSARAYWRSPWTCTWGQSGVRNRRGQVGIGGVLGAVGGCRLEGVGWRV